MKLSIWLTVYPWATEHGQPQGHFASTFPPTVAQNSRDGAKTYRVEVEVGDPIPTIAGEIVDELTPDATTEKETDR